MRMNRFRKALILMTWFLMASTTIFAQGLPDGLPFGGDFDADSDVTWEIGQVPEQARTGEAVRVSMTIKVASGFHITKELFALESVDDSFEVAQLTLPEGEPSAVGRILGGSIPVEAVIVPKKAGDHLGFRITFQACSEGENPVCYPPSSREGRFDISVEQGEQTLADRLVKALDSSILLALLIIFLGGIGASLTPCVYPVIPLTVAYVGARSEGHKFRGFILSVMLVLGIATTYSVLGVVSAKTGAVFGSFAQHPAFVITLAMIFVAMGLSMFGFYDIQLPSSLNTKLQVQRKGLLGAFLMGMATGVLAAPCVGPIIVVLLGWVAQTGSMFKGFIFLFDFALGMGLLFIVIGTFSGVLASLPKAGGWMIKVKYIFGVLFILAAMLFARPFLGDYFLPFVILAVLPLLLVLIGGKLVNRKSGIVLLVLFLAAFLAVQFMGKKSEGTTAYRTAVENALQKAQPDNRIVILDFYADWCAACKELDEFTWENEDVQELLKTDAILLKLDFTKVSPEGKAFQEKYRVVGLPTVVFLSPEGEEIGRFVGFIPARAFIKQFRSLRADGESPSEKPENNATEASAEPVAE